MFHILFTLFWQTEITRMSFFPFLRTSCNKYLVHTGKVPGDDCPLVWGQCSHCFHMHCILKWLNSQQVQQQCPMCRQEWKFKEWSCSPAQTRTQGHFHFDSSCEGLSSVLVLFHGLYLLIKFVIKMETHHRHCTAPAFHGVGLIASSERKAHDLNSSVLLTLIPFNELQSVCVFRSSSEETVGRCLMSDWKVYTKMRFLIRLNSSPVRTFGYRKPTAE